MLQFSRSCILARQANIVLGRSREIHMPSSDVLEMYLQEKYQCQRKYNGCKHQHPSGNHESFLSHNACALIAVGLREKEVNQ